MKLPTRRVRTDWHSEAVMMAGNLYGYVVDDSPEGDPLLRIRCGIGGCRRVTSLIYALPEDMSGEFSIGTCPKHDHRDGPPAELARKVRERGEVPRWSVRVALWTDVRALLCVSDTRGRTLEVTAGRE